MRTIHQTYANNRSKRAAVIVWTAVSATTLLGFAALAVDLGYVTVVHTQLQTAADASAMAGVSGLTDTSKFEFSTTQAMLVALAQSRAQDYANKNVAAGKALQLSSSDILVGYLANPENLQDSIVTATSEPYNAVHVVVRKDASANGPINLLFARIWGKQSAATWAQATAVIDDRVSGFEAQESGGPLLPITVRKAKWEAEIKNAGGQDCFGYDPETGQITQGPDGIPELSIYPEKQNKVFPEGSGNFGLLNFENGNSGQPPTGEQISRGLNANELLRTLGSETISFYNDAGNNTMYDITGNAGLKSSLSADFNTRIGDVVGYFLHTRVYTNGSNCTYDVVDMQFGRLLYVDLNGSVEAKAIVIQPVVYTGPEIRTKVNAPRNITAGQIKLVR